MTTCVHIKWSNHQEWFCFARRLGCRNWECLYRGRGKKRAYREMADAVASGKYFRATVTFFEDYYGHTQTAEAKKGAIKS